MAIFLNNKVGFKVGASPVDLSDHVTAFSLNRMSDQVEVTAMGSTAHQFVSGLTADSITVTFLNDTAAGSVLATLQAAYGTTIAFKAIQDSATAVSATNKLYTGTILVDNLTDINGAPADVATFDVTFTCNSTTALATTGTW
jgi:aconitase B